VEENIISILEKYNMQLESFNRGRGVYICKCNTGLKLLMECKLSKEKLKLQYDVMKDIMNNGLIKLDVINTTSQGEYSVTMEDGKSYILKDWYVGRECDLSQERDVLIAIETLALLHCELEKNEPLDTAFFENGFSIYERYAKKYRELRKVKNYLLQRRNKTEFEMYAQSNYNTFFEQARKSMEMLDKIELNGYVKHLCHGSYNYHNLIMENDSAIVTSMERLKYDVQILDLYDFMRKVLEKHDWELGLADKMLNEYQKLRPMDETEFELLKFAFMFPEKFWKIVNFYYNNSKAWIPQKNTEKLRMCISKEAYRKKFIESVFA